MTMMGNVDNKIVIQEYIEKVLNTGDVSTISNYVSPEYSEVHEGKRFELGVEGAIEHIKGVRNTYPDLKLVIEKQICEGEWVVTSYTMTGTHKGEWLGITPTNKKLTITGVNVDRIINGKIVEHGGAANLMEPLLKANAIRISK